MDNSYWGGIPPRIKDIFQGFADWLTDDVSVVIDRANIAPAPTAAAWSYSVPFRIVGATSGVVLPYNGTIGAAASDTSTAGTASVPAATVSVVNGSGTATLNGDAAAWLNSETATLTLQYTNLRGATDSDTFVCTFTS
jgi:hypothetical protein